jgi:transcriptional regulator with XRE-family HTH domain
LIAEANVADDCLFGAAIAKLRTAKGLKQSEITGLSERQVRRIEKGEGTTYESLRRLAAAHGMDTREVAEP